METVKISKVRPNEDNPRYIKEDKFKKLVQSLKDFPEMANARPIEVPVKIVDWSEEKQREFIIKDNVGFGEWDWDELANTWNAEELNEWGLDVWQPEATEEEPKQATEPQEVCPSCGK